MLDRVLVPRRSRVFPPRRARAVSISILGLAAALSYGASAAAQSRVVIQVGTVVASDDATPFDHQLASMRDSLEEAFGQRSYRLVKREDRGVKWGDHAEFEVPGGYRLRVLPKEARAPGVALTVALSHGDKTLMDTEVRVGSEGKVMVGGPKLDRGFLVIWIGAREEASPPASPPARP